MMIGRVAGWVLALLCIKTVNGVTTKLIITNDGPTILGASTTFTATLSIANETVDEQLPSDGFTTMLSIANETVDEQLPSDGKLNSERKFLYVYYWEQTLCGKTNVVTIEQNHNCMFIQPYNCPGDTGWHTVTVTVRRNTFFFKPLVIRNTTDFQITEHINANLTISNGVSCNYTYGLTTCDVVATNTSVAMGINIHDPSNFFKGATVIYHWVFGDGYSNTQINQPTISHVYKTPGHYGIAVNMTAIFSDSISARQPKTGNLNHHLQTMDSIRRLTIRGKNELKEGVKASYNISCHASLPVDFCWYVIPITTHTSVSNPADVISCNTTRLTDRTWLVVHHWFNNSGGYSIGVYANNAISSSNSDMNIHAESPRNSQGITGLIIGILFGIAGCFLCVAVITNYMRRHQYRHVEIANFDFQGSARHQYTLGTKIRQFMLGATRGESLPLRKDFNTNQLM